MDLRQQGQKPGDFSGVDIGSSDPLKRYPAHDPHAPLGQTQPRLDDRPSASTVG
jgi:hypothetical protein